MENKFILEFDSPPRIVYVSEDGTGCGRIYVDGKRQVGVIEVRIEAKTNDPTTHEIKFATIRK